MQPTKDDIKKQFARTSHGYATSKTHATDNDLAQIVDLLEIDPTLLVLDVATGTGHTAMAIAPHVARVVGIDLTPEMLERGQELANERGITNIEFLPMEAESLRFADATFDRVTCRIAPHHFLDVQLAVKEIARVLKPGGVFVLEDSIAPEDQQLDAFINTVEKIRDPTHVRSYSMNEWTAFLTAAGISITQYTIFRKEHDMDDWLSRGTDDPVAQQHVLEMFQQASPAAREHYAVVFAEQQPLAFTDDKIILQAMKTP